MKKKVATKSIAARKSAAKLSNRRWSRTTVTMLVNGGISARKLSDLIGTALLIDSELDRAAAPCEVDVQSTLGPELKK